MGLLYLIYIYIYIFQTPRTRGCLDKLMVRKWKSVTQTTEHPVLTQTHKICAFYIAKHPSCKTTCSCQSICSPGNVAVNGDALSQTRKITIGRFQSMFWNTTNIHGNLFPFQRRPFIPVYLFPLGTAVAQWLRCCATNRKVAGSIPAGVIGFRSPYGPEVDSTSNRNEYQEHFLGVKAAGA